MRFWLRPLRYLAEVLRETATPTLVGLGAALGMVIGLVPKDNLTALILTSLLLGTRFNLAAAAVTAFAFSWVGMLIDPLAHACGHKLLTIDGLQPAYAFFYNLPVVPWTGLNNTVVAGQLVFGCLLFYPVYRASRYAAERHGPRLVSKIQKYPAYQVLFGVEWAAGMKLK